MAKSGSCSICFGNEHSIYWIEELDDNKTKYTTKLQVVVPEIQWNYRHYLCASCVCNLNIAFEFRELCIKSLQNLENKVEPENLAKCEETDITGNDIDAGGSDPEQEQNDPEGSMNKTTSNFNLEKGFTVEESCEQCGKHFVNRTLLFKHFKSVHKYEKPYSCSTCRDSFKKKLDLVKHEKTHKFHCNICNKLYSNYSILRRHVVVKHTSKSSWKYTCCYCNDFFPTNTHLLTHSKKAHQTSETFLCSHCNKEFNDKNILLDHIIQEHQNDEIIGNSEVQLSIRKNCNEKECQTPDDLAERILQSDMKVESENMENDGKRRPCRTFPCETCGKILNSSVKLVNHCVTEHNANAKSVKPFACDLCEKRFSTSTILTEHKRYHTRNRQNICSFCGKGFITKNDLNCHEYIHFNERSFKCEICFKGFNTQKNLRTHRIVKHGDPMSWKHCCSICNKRFAILSNYKVHVRRHMGDKQFCCQLCDKKFVNKDELRQHIESHSNIREFKCQLCEKEYKKKRIYEIHLTKIHGIGNAKIPKKEKKHMCHLCPKSYFEKSKLTKHLMTHSGIKPFGCTVCDKKFTDNYYLKQHLKNSHGHVVMSCPDNESCME